MAFGKWMHTVEGGNLERVWMLGVAFLAGFMILRALDGFGNIRPRIGNTWIAFLNVVKYPPSITFILLTMGVNLVALSFFARLKPGVRRLVGPLVVFGRVPLFFYVAHLFIYAGMGNLISPRGMSIPAMVPFWLAGLLGLYPACLVYGRFKARQPANSIFRLF
jgi:uncharacterized membrane protein